MTSRDHSRHVSSGHISDDVRQRIDDLIGQMTPAEKAGQLTQYFYFGALKDMPPLDGSDGPSQPEMVHQALKRGEAGALLFVTDPAEVNRLQRMAVEETRLGIPLLFGFDVIHGFRTIFPVPIGLAASWDPDIVETAQSVAAREARAVGIHWTFAPMVDIARDPRWGRMIEGAGEDPYLGSAIARAQVRGFQGDNPADPDRVIAGPKHFAGYGAALGGRDYDEVNLSDSELWNVYLPPFEAAIRAGCGNIMTGYMDLNGIPAAGNAWLFTEVLRKIWGFEGFVVSDANAVRDLATHHFARDIADAGARALNAGVDMEMAIFDPAFHSLPDKLAQGHIAEETLDASVRRVLEAKFRLGLFDNPYVDEGVASATLDEARHREQARIAAERSAVLLRNDNSTLPLNRESIGKLAVIGPFADDTREIVGPWTFNDDAGETITILQGIQDKVGADVEVLHAPGIRRAHRRFPSMFDTFAGSVPDQQPDFDDAAEFDRAIDIARSADIAIVTVGEWQNMIGENASRSSLELPGRQLELLEAIVETGTPVVLLVLNGRPVDLRWAAEHVPAILDIWYPGTQGGAAVANLLFGEVSPAGRLPFSWPRSVGQVPMIHSHTMSHQPEKQDQRYWDEASTPLFPFGFGLSYSSFDYTDLKAEPTAMTAGESLTITVTVTNTGTLPTDEVAQLYIHQRYGTASRPARELKGFRRVTLEAGASATLTFPLGPDELRYWNAGIRDWTIDSSTFDVWVGGSSEATLATTFEITES